MENFTAVNLELAQCLKLCADGDKSAFTKLYKLTAPKLQAIVAGMVKSDALAADILQSAYLSIWKKAHAFDPEKGKAFTWMLVVTRNRAYDELRRLKRTGVTLELPENIIDDLEIT